MERSVEARVSQAVDAWLRWLPRWQPATGRTRPRICSRCYGSPLAEASGLTGSGLGGEVPHAVQHALIMRLTAIVDDEVDRYTEHNLPLLHGELHRAELRRRRAPYRAAEGLAPEHRGLELDPEPLPGEPFLFTLAELEQSAAQELPPVDPPADFSAEAKAALRHEIALSDEAAARSGQQVCAAVREHRERIALGVAECVEPMIQELLAELEHELRLPPGFGD